MKKSLVALTVILLISTVLSGCSKQPSSESSATQTNFDSTTVEETTVEETTEGHNEYEDDVVDILNSTSQVTISGNYRNTPDEYYNNSGNAYIVINLTNDTCTLTGDHDYTSAAEDYAFEVTGFY